MAVIRKQDKALMVTSLVEHAFKKRIVDLGKALNAVGDKIHNDAYAAHLKAMNSLPDGFLVKSGSFYIAINGQKRQVSFSSQKLLGREHNQWNEVAKHYRDDDALIKEYESACDLLKQAKSERDKAERQATAVLDRCTTFKKLWETWPESFEILKHFDQPSGAVHLPAIPMPELNKAFGLPVPA